MDPRKKRKWQAGNNPRLAQSQSLNGEQLTLPEWVVKINDLLDEGQTYDSGRSWGIYRVPNNLRQVHKNSFTPKIVSMGPLYYKENKGRLQAMEEHKIRFLMRLLGGKFDRKSSGGECTMEEAREESVGNQNGNVGIVSRSVRLKDLWSAMTKLENKARACYSESFDYINSEDFVRMLVMDGCFILQLLRLYYKQHKGENVDDPIFTTPWMLKTLQHDLLMLENQLPFIVLEELYTLIKEADPVVASVPLEELAVVFFNALLPRKDVAAKLNNIRYCNHLLEIFRSTFLKSVCEKVEKKKTPNLRIPQMSSDGNVSGLTEESQLKHFTSELQEAGVKLQTRRDCDLLDIVFKDDTLSMPPLSINDDTVPLFLNFVAHEQCDEQAKPFFTSYFVFLDSLVNSPSDIQILHKHGIVEHGLKSNREVADLLHKLRREIVCDVGPYYLYDETTKVNEYCKPYDESTLRWVRMFLRKTWMNFIEQYKESPCKFFSLLGAIILLVLTVLQTVYTVCTYDQSNSSGGLQRWSLKFLL